MVRITHQDRIIVLLAESPGLDDDEITKALEISQRQQVNQICRLMESQGKLKRERGASGKIQNYLIPESEQFDSNRDDHAPLPVPSRIPEIRLKQEVDLPGEQLRSESVVTHELNITPELASTLIVIPCSGAKAPFSGQRHKGKSILDKLPEETARELVIARAVVRDRAGVDERSLMPAWERYQGTLYTSARQALSKAVENQLHVVILSGGYGVVLATESIGNYNAVFKSSWWPKGLLEQILATYVATNKLRHVRAFVSATTSYRKIIERVDWLGTSVEDTVLFVPEQTTGAMVKAPRAQGEALTALLEGRLNPGWRSSDGLGVRAARIA